MKKLILLGCLVFMAAPMFASPAPEPSPAAGAALTLTYYWLPG